MQIQDANEAWMTLLKTLTVDGRKAKPRGQDTKELMGVQSTFDMNRPMITWEERASGGNFHAFMLAEAAWILSGDNRVSSIRKFSDKIAQFSDSGYEFFGSYGLKIRDQMNHVVKSLAEDNDSRQAVINIWRENPPKSKDIPCTLSAQWMIRDGRLCCFDTMRSSDAWLGWPFDVFNFSMLSLAILIRLKREHGIDVELGSMALTAASQHLYERNYDAVSRQIVASWRGTGPGMRPAPVLVRIAEKAKNLESMDDVVGSLWLGANMLLEKSPLETSLMRTGLFSVTPWSPVTP